MTVGERASGGGGSSDGNGGAPRLRPLERDDLGDVARLRRHAFDRTRHGSVPDLRDYMEWLFFESPWADETLPSLVLRSPDGALRGFLGVLGHRIRLGGRRLRAAVSTQLMVTDASGPLAALRLLRSYLDGDQELSWSDQASSGVRRLWERSGGRVLERASQRWLRPLRPYRWITGELGTGTAGRAVRFLLRPICGALDSGWLRWGRNAFPRNPAGTRRALSAAEAAAVTDDVAGDGELCPAFSADELGVILGELERRGPGPAGSVVHGDDGEPLGWYLFRSNPGGESRVPALVARPSGARRVLRHLFAEAHRRGTVVLSGRVAPVHAGALSDVGCLWSRRGPWVLAHSTDPDVDAALQAERSSLTPLGGEGWLRF